MHMKTYLIPTDFSSASKNASRYAIHFANVMKAKLELCNAMNIPAESPMAAQFAWPLEGYYSVYKNTEEELKLMEHELTREFSDNDASTAMIPQISHCCDSGSVTEVVGKTLQVIKAQMVILGLSGADSISRFVLGSNSKKLIDTVPVPILLVPPTYQYVPIKKIAFATDLSKTDIDVIHSIVSLAKYFNAEILISHVSPDGTEKDCKEKEIAEFLNEVTGKVNYSKIYYRDLRNKKVVSGLGWLTESGMIDMLVMVHRHNHFYDKVFSDSYTQKLAKHITIPLLVIPDKHLPLF
jgi:nucleotide-binding universal stress UspA family protein